MKSTDPPTDPTAQRATELVLAQVQDLSDATERAKAVGAILDAIPYLQANLRSTRQTAVREMRAGGMSHADVAQALGLSRSRAQAIAEGRSDSAKSRRAAKETTDAG
ncbi:hypothetical protein [Actinomadura opuntiae]|uniref:hypothetical protein n=1 Tax=Actinomadura sp. OS1-43 TaxID=604315 RepID=UPI00255AEF63|nr:hypothetical protein [Actinomadura sp. OS1-43]MDL4812779.1 hypothetical protein [Actinomadura sp. OS1-43]